MRDCARDTLEAEQQRLGCLGAADRFGHFREPDVVSAKLHWVWMWHWIFSVFLPEDFAGNVLAVTDDCVVSSRHFYRNAQEMWRLHAKLCPTCRGVSLLNPVHREEGRKNLAVLQGGNKA